MGNKCYFDVADVDKKASENATGHKASGDGGHVPCAVQNSRQEPLETWLV